MITRPKRKLRIGAYNHRPTLQVKIGMVSNQNTNTKMGLDFQAFSIDFLPSYTLQGEHSLLIGPFKLYMVVHDIISSSRVS